MFFIYYSCFFTYFIYPFISCFLSFFFLFDSFFSVFYHSLSIHFIYIPINAIDIDILFYVNLHFQQFTVFLYNISFWYKKIHLMVDLILKQKKNSWQLPIFAFTIVGVEWLNFCVRDGNRCTSLAIVTKKIWEIIPWKLRYCVHQIINYD